MEKKEFLAAISGRDSNNQSKAIISFNILGVSDDEEDIIQLEDTVCYDGVVYVAIQPEQLSIIDILWKNPTDYEFVRVEELLQRYNEYLKNYNQNDDVQHFLSVSIVAAGNLAANMNVLNCIWSYTTDNQYKICNGVRLITLSDNIKFTELNEEQLDILLDDIIENSDYNELNFMESMLGGVDSEN